MTTQQVSERNPFMLMVSPEVVLAAMEKSEFLNGLKSQLCRPLDRPAPAVAGKAGMVDDDESDDEDGVLLGN